MSEVHGFLIVVFYALAVLGLLSVCSFVVLVLACRERRNDMRARREMPLAYRDESEHEAWVREFAPAKGRPHLAAMQARPENPNDREWAIRLAMWQREQDGDAS